MEAVVLILFAVILIGLVLERRQVLKDRAGLEHVVYVNGIRGKSTVTRLIDAGLRAGGKKVFCKTTGTVPMTIGVDNVERPLHRPGKANIKEQLNMLHRAAGEGAEILVLECMAVDPVLQNVTQHQMLHADIGVITNVRLDHTAEMGETLEEICDSLSNTIPRDGHLFTADPDFFPQLERNSRPLNCTAHLAVPTGDEPHIDFPENLALALSVCEHLGVAREVALSGMMKYQRDPFALSLHRLPGGGVFVNGMSINDPQSTQLVFRRLAAQYGWKAEDLILLINNRPDRGYRTRHMVMVAHALTPPVVWLAGASQMTTKRAILKGVPHAEILCFKSGEEVPVLDVPAGKVVFAVGNLAGPGHAIMKQVREEATDYV